MQFLNMIHYSGCDYVGTFGDDVNRGLPTGGLLFWNPPALSDDIVINCKKT
jgi:hypothetical protein